MLTSMLCRMLGKAGREKWKSINVAVVGRTYTVIGTLDPRCNARVTDQLAYIKQQDESIG
uniref:Uncharacterized protein n=1 Tax=Helianthus annuus TaxID=4232 RepID=A0A251SPU0_HELAN